MSRYVGPERRRRRRAVEGPVGDEPPEFEPQRVVRVMRCPRCRATIGTMRRWRMACPECGHEWEEESQRTVADKLADARTSFAEYAVMALMWGGLAGVVALFIGGLVYVGMRLTGGGNIVGAIVVAALLFVGLVVLGAVQSSRFEAAARYTWWRRGWRDRS